jgi:hypothetical protein
MVVFDVDNVTENANRRQQSTKASSIIGCAPPPVSYSVDMAPTIVRDGQFRLFFFSREETRIHVHVAHVDGEAKFWLTPQVVLADHIGLSATQLRQAQAVVNVHLKEIQDAWEHHFGS